MVFREDAARQVVAFTAQQIPHIADRRYPVSLAGPLYPDGIPIHPEDQLEALIARHGVDLCVMAYSDVSHDDVMHLASRANPAGADFTLLGVDRTMLRARVPVVAGCASRTGAGKSQTVTAFRRFGGIRRAPPIIMMRRIAAHQQLEHATRGRTEQGGQIIGHHIAADIGGMFEERGVGRQPTTSNTPKRAASSTVRTPTASVNGRSRGRSQLGTVGSGNHFIEIGYVDKIFDADVAARFGLARDLVTVLIHSGSRGLGYQVCDDYLRTMLMVASAPASSCPTASSQSYRATWPATRTCWSARIGPFARASVPAATAPGGA